MEAVTRWAIPIFTQYNNLQWKVSWIVFSILRMLFGWIVQTESAHLQFRLHGFLLLYFVIQNLIRPFFHILEIDCSRIVVNGIKNRIFTCILDSYETYRESSSYVQFLTNRGRKNRKAHFRKHWSSLYLISFTTKLKWLNVQRYSLWNEL